MTAQKKFALFLALAAVLAGLVFALQALLQDPTRDRIEPLAAASEAAPVDPARAVAAASSSADEVVALDEADRANSSARVHVSDERPLAGKGEQNFSLEGAGSVSVLVTFPAGTPADEEVSVVVLSVEGELEQSPLNWMLNGRDMGDFDASHLPLFAEQSEPNPNPIHWSRRELDVAHRASLPYPAGATELFVLLECHYLYMEELTRAKVADLPAEVLLAPKLGARLLGRCILPAGYERRDVDPLALAGRVQLFALPQSNGGVQRGMFQREQELTESGEFDQGALPAGLSLTYQVSLEHLLPERRVDTINLVAGETHQVEARFLLGGSVRGRVLDPDRQPVAQASVRTNRRNNGFMSYAGADGETTDSEGRFVLQGLPDGELTLVASAKGWKETTSDELTLGAEEERSGIEIVLERGLSILGQVLLPDGSPADGARLTLLQSNEAGGRAWQNTLEVAAAGEEGRFAFRGLAEGSFAVEGRVNQSLAEQGDGAERSYFARRDNIASGTEGVEIQLAATLALVGRVLDDQGDPLKIFSVTATPMAADGTSVGNANSVSSSFDDVEGRFSLAGLFASPWQITATAQGHHMADGGVAITIPRAEEALEIRLLRCASVAGTVFDPLGNPVPLASVGPARARSDQPAFVVRNDDNDSVQTGLEGHFVLENLPPGSFAVQARESDWAASDSQTLELTPGQLVEGIVLTLKNGGRIVGDAFDETGDPLAGRQVSLGMSFFGLGAEDGSGQTSDASGHFVFEHVDPGRYVVTLTPPQDEFMAAINGGESEAGVMDVLSKMITEKVTVVEGEEVYVRLGAEPKRPVLVSGKVTEAGEPVNSGMVFGISEGRSIMQGMKMAQIDSGRYEFTLDRPGAYVFGLQTEGTEAPLEFEVDVPALDTFEQDLAIPRGAIHGTVFGTDGKPAPSIPIRVSRESGAFSLSLDTNPNHRTDSAGRYKVEHLRPDRYVVRAGGGFRFDTEAGKVPGVEVVSGIDVEADAIVTGVDIHLREAGVIEGTTVDSAGKPVGGMSIFARNEQGALLAILSPTTSEATGHFRYQGVPAGNVTLSARGNGLAAKDGTAIHVRAGETSLAEIVVEPGTMLLITVEDENGDSMRATIRVTDERGRDVSAMYPESGIESLLMEGLDSKQSRFGPLPPGKYEVRATAKDGRWNAKPVSLSGKDERSLRIKIKE